VKNFALANAGNIDIALELAQKTEQPEIKASLLVAAGEFEQALAVSQKPRAGFGGPRMRLLRRIASALAAAKEISQAVEVARTIEGGNQMHVDHALSSGASETARAGEFAQALELAQQIDNRARKTSAVLSIASVMADAGKVAQAVEVARTIKNGRDRTVALAHIAVRLATKPVPNNETAKPGLRDHRPIKTAFTSAETQLARQLVEIVQGNKQPATVGAPWQTPARLALFMAQKQGTEETQSTQVLVSIVFALAAAGKLEQAVDVALKIEDESTHGRALESIATALAESGDTEQALKVAQTIEGEYSKASALESIATVLAKAGDGKQALKVTSRIEELSTRERALSGVASGLAAAGNAKLALEVARGVKHLLWPLRENSNALWKSLRELTTHSLVDLLYVKSARLWQMSQKSNRRRRWFRRSKIKVPAACLCCGSPWPRTGRPISDTFWMWLIRSKTWDQEDRLW